MTLEQGSLTPEDAKKAVQEAERLLAEALLQPPSYTPRDVYCTTEEFRSRLILGCTFVLGVGIGIAGQVLNIEPTKIAGFILAGTSAAIWVFGH